MTEENTTNPNYCPGGSHHCRGFHQGIHECCWCGQKPQQTVIKKVEP